MTNPTPYSLTYSFSDWQADNPTRPMPAPELENEFAALQQTTDTIISSLAQVRRADGSLNNQTVTWDALDPDILEAFTGQGEMIVVNDLSPTAFATTLQATIGVANDKLMTPALTTAAIGAQRAFATTEQAEAGFLTSVVMSPGTTTAAIDAQRAFASLAQAQAGTNETTVLSPLRGAQLLAALRPAFTGTANLTWGPIAAGASSAQSITVNGAQVGDRVLLGLPATGVDVGLVMQGWVLSPNSVRVRITNLTASSITPYSGAATALTVTTLRF